MLRLQSEIFAFERSEVALSGRSDWLLRFTISQEILRSAKRCFRGPYTSWTAAEHTMFAVTADGAKANA